MEGKKVIIGIAGKKGAGKDTVASMIYYIMSHSHNNCKYSEWLTFRHIWDNEGSTVHFANILKDVVSIILGVKRELLDDRDYKDKLYFNIYSRKFIEKIEFPYFEADLKYLSNVDGVLMHDYTDKNKCIKIRTFLQWFATEVCREKVGKDIWINATMPNIDKALDTYGFCCVADVRFIDEVRALKCCSLYGGGIYIKRDSCEQDEHISEQYIPDDYVIIENNGTLMQLFYNVYEYVQTLLKN